MSTLNQTPSGERIHIAFFGRRNAGKSSLVNAFTGQDLAIVSDVAGTTTDPVYKAMELLPMGPVQIIDTPGLDDVGELGEMRVMKAKQVLNKTDVAIVVIDASKGKTQVEEEIIALVKDKNIPYVTVFNKIDLLDSVPVPSENEIYVSAKEKKNIEELKELVAKMAQGQENQQKIVSDLLSPCDNVLLVVPIDKSAPKGRLILPQQQTIRDILDVGACATVCRDTELENVLSSMREPPRMVITDSQVFGKIKDIVPPSVELTSFSILMARHKGSLKSSILGAKAIETLCDGDRVLIAEGCTHHRQCEDIGTVKIPAMIRKYTGVDPEFVFTSGGTFPEDLSPYKMVVHCGGCTLPEKEMKYRMRSCKDSYVPVTNYGILIAYINGIIKRSIAPFPEFLGILE
ncbi:MAG: [FeFe] hydrogenase H-cluster maturation GTPase HydF [Ruminococcaceae bacterium]|nr:[FeFe] hydrogenase H-cluster maturation GTPase HydF [Oscillospiraceae bacterium]